MVSVLSVGEGNSRFFVAVPVWDPSPEIVVRNIKSAGNGADLDNVVDSLVGRGYYDCGLNSNGLRVLRAPNKDIDIRRTYTHNYSEQFSPTNLQ